MLIDLVTAAAESDQVPPESPAFAGLFFAPAILASVPAYLVGCIHLVWSILSAGRLPLRRLSGLTATERQRLVADRPPIQVIAIVLCAIAALSPGIFYFTPLGWAIVWGAYIGIRAAVLLGRRALVGSGWVAIQVFAYVSTGIAVLAIAVLATLPYDEWWEVPVAALAMLVLLGGSAGFIVLSRQFACAAALDYDVARRYWEIVEGRRAAV